MCGVTLKKQYLVIWLLGGIMSWMEKPGSSTKVIGRSQLRDCSRAQPVNPLESKPPNSIVTRQILSICDQTIVDFVPPSNPVEIKHILKYIRKSLWWSLRITMRNFTAYLLHSNYTTCFFFHIKNSFVDIKTVHLCYVPCQVIYYGWVRQNTIKILLQVNIIFLNCLTIFLYMPNCRVFDVMLSFFHS